MSVHARLIGDMRYLFEFMKFLSGFALIVALALLALRFTAIASAW